MTRVRGRSGHRRSATSAPPSNAAGAALGAAPAFALLLSCVGRGPHFYGNRDRDLEQLRAQYPGLPVIGFYGNGEIAPLDGANHLYQYSAVLGLYRLAGA